MLWLYYSLMYGKLYVELSDIRVAFNLYGCKIIPVSMFSTASATTFKLTSVILQSMNGS